MGKCHAARGLIYRRGHAAREGIQNLVQYSFHSPSQSIDADLAEIGRNYPTELGVMADAKLALGALAHAASGVEHRDRGTLQQEIAHGRKSFMDNWDHQRTSDQYPLRPERILSELRDALPEDGFVVTTSDGIRTAWPSNFPITIPGSFITPSEGSQLGLWSVGSSKVRRWHSPSRRLLVGGGFGAANPWSLTAMEAKLSVVWW
jgi:acetolactate synthase-1/2/3 large subunit